VALGYYGHSVTLDHSVILGHCGHSVTVILNGGLVGHIVATLDITF